MNVQLAFDLGDPEGNLHAELLGPPAKGDMVVAGGRTFVVQAICWFAEGDKNPPLCLAVVSESDSLIARAFASMIPQGPQLVWNKDRPDGE